MAGSPPDWYASETPLGRVWVTELQRLKRRARARPLTILALTLAVTGALMFMIARKPRFARSRIVIAVTEGDLGSGRTPTSMGELRDYVATVLLPNAKLLPIIEDYPAKFPLRRKLGDNFALAELRDMFDISVWRNYFLYEYSLDERRSARIAVTVNHVDPDFSVVLVRRLTSLIIDEEADRRRAAALALAAEAQTVIDAARKKLVAIERELGEKLVEQAEAELAHSPKTIALKTEVQALSQALSHEREKLDTINREASIDQVDNAVTQAGLGMGLEIADERLPPEDDGRHPFKLAVLGIALFFFLMPLVAIVIGSFDSRIHDLEDVSRLGFPIVGHVPAFPGDTAGSLRERGIRRRRVPSF